MTSSTAFAPPEREGDEELERQSQKLGGIRYLRQFLDAFPSPCAVLNRRRQIVLVNRSFLDVAGAPGSAGASGRLTALPFPIGRRPGEALDCIHARDGPGGCGTSPFCRTCGAVRASLGAGEDGKERVEDCLMSRRDRNGLEQALEFQVWASPISIDGEDFVIFSVKDVSAEKRRQALERIFFHDLMNTAGSLKSLSDFLPGQELSREGQEILALIRMSGAQLVEEIEAQRMFFLAEAGELLVGREPVSTADLLGRVASQYSRHSLAAEKDLRLEESPDITILTNAMVLSRVIGNMVKNALEASGPRDMVSLGCRREEGTVEFWVHNTSSIPQEVQLQIFGRSFSTRGAGRGLGTYSIKLLTERYLGGSVSFTSSPEAGTTFRVRCPLNCDGGDR